MRDDIASSTDAVFTLEFVVQDPITGLQTHSYEVQFTREEMENISNKAFSLDMTIEEYVMFKLESGGN